MNATMTGKKISNTVSVKFLLEKIRANPKIIIAIFSAAALSLILVLLLWARSPDYRLLYSNINDRDAGAIVAQLTQQQIPYRFEEREGAIMVPDNLVYDTRLKLAQLGLPKGSTVGFELMDKEKFGISQFNEQINYQRALEGELVRTIETLAPVNRARVHLALPKPSLFVREQKKPSASVTLSLNSGLPLEVNQVNAITHMISSAIPGLEAKNVTIVDQNGQLLTAYDGQATHHHQLKYINDIEADYLRRIVTILAPIVGEQNVKAQVAVQFDFSEQEQTAERYQPNVLPEHRAIRSQQSNLAEQRGKNAVGGIPGALSNQPPVPSTALIDKPGDSGKADSDDKAPAPGTVPATNGMDKPAISVPYHHRHDETTNYELDRTLIHTRKNAGTLLRLSAAVVVNYLTNGDGEKVALPQKQLDEITALVKEAIGYSAERGDSLNIVNMAFSQPEEMADLPLWKQPEVMHSAMQILRYLLVGLIAWLLWRKVLQPQLIKHHELALKRLAVEEAAKLAEKEASVRQEERKMQHEHQQREQCSADVQKLRELAGNDPQIVALVLRQWMQKEQGPI